MRSKGFLSSSRHGGKSDAAKKRIKDFSVELVRNEYEDKVKTEEEIKEEAAEKAKKKIKEVR